MYSLSFDKFFVIITCWEGIRGRYTIPRCSFVFGQSRAYVSAGFTNVRSRAVAAFDLVYRSVCPPVCLCP